PRASRSCSRSRDRRRDPGACRSRCEARARAGPRGRRGGRSRGRSGRTNGGGSSWDLLASAAQLLQVSPKERQAGERRQKIARREQKAEGRGGLGIEVGPVEGDQRGVPRAEPGEGERHEPGEDRERREADVDQERAPGPERQDEDPEL